MIQDTYKTKVVFRKFPDGEIIALFPELHNYMESWLIESYIHIGQHGAASYHVVSETKLATPNEYADLKDELESIGYNLDVRKKIMR